MGQSDRLSAAVPLNSHRKDYVLYTGGGLGGGGSLTVAGVRRHSTFVDINRFDVYIRQATFQNASFEVFSDSGGLNRQPLYFGVSHSNDQPTEEIIAGATVANGLQFAGAPPYDIELADLGEPFADLTASVQGNQFSVDGRFFYDQGGYIYPYVTTFGTTYGNNNKLVQSFVPTSDRILNIAIGALFFDYSTYSTTDASLRDDQVIEVWDQNLNTIYSETISKFAPTSTGSVSSSYPYSWNRVDGWSSTNIAGSNYWDYLSGYKLQPTSPLIVTPGQTHYLVFKQASNHATNTYGVGDNVNRDGTARDPIKGQYINGQLYWTSYGATSPLTVQWFAGACVGFVTTRDVGRFCLTAAWDSSSYYWYNPATVADTIKITRLDSDRRV